MRLGALITLTDPADPKALADRARALEAAGYSSIWSVHATGRGFLLPDPFLALTTAATVTELEVGTAILQLPLHDPADVAIKAFTLAQLTDGRFVLGVGVGSTAADYTVHQRPFRERFDRFDTALAELRQTLADGSANGGNITPWQHVVGQVPVYFGTWGRNVERAATEFDGWIASGMHRTPEQCAEALKTYRAAGGGRAIVTTITVRPDDDLGELRDRLTAYSAAGFDDAVVMCLPGVSIDGVRALV